MDWYLEALRKFAQFDGRARRKEYWFFSLFVVLIYIALIVFAVAVGGLLHHSGGSAIGGVAAIPAIVFILAMFIPGLAVTVRRLHDTGRSGWWYFISFVPLVGPIVVLIFTLLDGDPGPNLYGPDPKGRGGYIPPYPMPPQY